MTSFWEKSVRLLTRLAIAFGLSTAAAILFGAAVTDNGFVQIVVTMLAALAFWIPFAVLVTKVEGFFARGRSRRAGRAVPDRNVEPRAHIEPAEDCWRRLTAVAPGQSDRLSVLRRSLERSRLALGQAKLDPGAHDLCLLIDRRLPELIDRELDTLAPDDRNRARQLGDLIDLVEQFARHCSREQSSDAAEAAFRAEVLRRRFEDRLGPQTLTGINRP